MNVTVFKSSNVSNLLLLVAEELALFTVVLLCIEFVQLFALHGPNYNGGYLVNMTGEMGDE